MQIRYYQCNNYVFIIGFTNNWVGYYQVEQLISLTNGIDALTITLISIAYYLLQ